MALRRTIAALSALGLAASIGLSACGKPSEEAGIEEPAREGLAIPIAGAEYNVFITRQLNLDVVPDNAYYDGPEPEKGETYYGIFLQVCNQGKKPVRTADQFTVHDNQGNEFEPAELPEDNVFAYQAKKLDPTQCIPEVGSVAQLGPAAGSMLLFKLPLEVTENRPLELEIEGPFEPLKGPERETRKIELDL